jgi:REP element-mobilizing transposase RayT
MPQSLAAVYVHVVFSTKDRTPWIRDEHLAELHEYLGGTANRLQCQSLGVSGVADHAHMLVRLSRTSTLSDLVRDLKSNSSGWMKDKARDFSWQSGYGAFSFSQADLPRLRAYLAVQHEHHAKVSFQDELRALLREHGLEWDERYLWD